PQNVGAIGVTGTSAANCLARDADLLLGIGTRYSDFTTASKTAFLNPDVRFVNINVCEFDAFKHAALALVGDARSTIEELAESNSGYQVTAQYRASIAQLRCEWEEEVARINSGASSRPVRQAEIIEILNNFTTESDILVCAAGSLPGDLHKLWRTSRAG